MSNILRLFQRIPRPYVWALASGILVGTSYIPFPGWALLFCFVPLWLAALQLNIENVPLKKIFFAGWCTQFILTLIGFNWIFFLASEFGEFNWLMSLGSLLIFAATVHIYIPLSLTLAIWIIRKREINSKLLQLLTIALAHALLERVWPSIFEWNLAYSLLYMNVPVFQWADTVGFWGLSTLILVTQAVLGFAWLHRQIDRKLSVGLTAAVFVFIFALAGTGLMKEKRWTKTNATVNFAIAQGNIGNADKVQSEKKEGYQHYILDHYTQLTDEHLAVAKDSEIMLWPETAIPIALDAAYHNRHLQQILMQKVQQWNVVLLTGKWNPTENFYTLDAHLKKHQND